MSDVLLGLLQGQIDLPWWGYVLVVAGLTHITAASITIFLHRHQAHRALDLHPLPSHFFRFWLWIATGMVTKEWAAIHRKHHAHCETENDPHSPQVLGLHKVMTEGAELYRKEARNDETMRKYGHGTPDDWLERNVYSRHNVIGVSLLAVVFFIAFGVNGIWMWALQMGWTPFFAAGVINGLGHFWGYRNFECEDASTNLLPWGILIAGEELHNNHHTFGTSAKLSVKWYEFDMGWAYIRVLQALGLAKVRRTMPKPRLISAKPACDEDTLLAIIANRYEVVSRFTQSLKTTCGRELAQVQAKLPSIDIRKWRKCVNADAKSLDVAERAELNQILAHSTVLETIHTMRQDLAALWARSSSSREQLLQELQDWCARAEASGIEALRDFARSLHCYANA